MFINQYYGNRGIFPVDSFAHFDTGSKKAKDAKNKKIEVTDGVRQVSPTARNLLRSMEYNGSFSTNLDNEGVYYELILPPDPDMKEALSNLTDTLTELQKNNFTVSPLFLFSVL